MIEIKDIYKSFGEQKVLQGLNMSIEKGKIHTIIGGNGTGKTTLFNLISGFLQVDKGEILFNKKCIENHSPISINANGITRTFQDLRIINELSVKENILLSFKNNPGEQILNSILPACIFKSQYKEFSTNADNILNEVHLRKVSESLASEISYGQQKLLTIGCCIANNAQLLLLDEPVAGIDKDNYILICELIIKLKEEGKTIIQIEHNHDFIKKLSDKIWFLNSGQTVLFDNYESFINNQIVKETYLS